MAVAEVAVEELVIGAPMQIQKVVDLVDLVGPLGRLEGLEDLVDLEVGLEMDTLITGHPVRLERPVCLLLVYLVLNLREADLLEQLIRVDIFIVMLAEEAEAAEAVVDMVVTEVMVVLAWVLNTEPVTAEEAEAEAAVVEVMAQLVVILESVTPTRLLLAEILELLMAVEEAEVMDRSEKTQPIYAEAVGEVMALMIMEAVEMAEERMENLEFVY